ncbi:unnamed protein product, partial [Heterotrigona itama]
YAEEVINSFRFVVLCAIVISTIVLTLCGVTLIMSMHVSRSAYDLIWYKQTLIMQKNLLNVLAYQKPVTFSISFIIPDLSLRYYCS